MNYDSSIGCNISNARVQDCVSQWMYIYQPRLTFGCLIADSDPVDAIRTTTSIAKDGARVAILSARVYLGKSDSKRISSVDNNLMLVGKTCDLQHGTVSPLLRHEFFSSGCYLYHFNSINQSIFRKCWGFASWLVVCRTNESMNLVLVMAKPQFGFACNRHNWARIRWLQRLLYCNTYFSKWCSLF